MPLIRRNAASKLRDLMATFRIVVVSGARQTGKTTLVRELIELPESSVLSFDDEATLARALDDPAGFVELLPIPAAVDEFQRAGRGLLLAVKRVADQDRTRGRIILTGSANYQADRGLTETLAGRTGRLTLWPLSVGERLGLTENFLDRLFDPVPWSGIEGMPRAELVEWILRGGFPEVVTEGLDNGRRRDWFEAYVLDVVNREALRPMVDIRLETELRGLLRLVAARTSQELVITSVAGDADLGRETTSDYLALLEALHLVKSIPAWSTNATVRAKRRPKAVVVDTGLAADLTGTGPEAFALNADGRMAGALFETFVITEIAKQQAWNQRSVDLAHFRDRRGSEVDLIIEDRRTTELAAIEIKLTASPAERHAKHLMMLRDRLGERFRVGLVIHAGSHSLPLGDRIWAVPVTALWHRF